MDKDKYITNDDLMTYKDLANLLGITVQTLKNNISAGKIQIPRIQINKKKFYYLRSDVTKWFENQRRLPKKTVRNRPEFILPKSQKEGN